MDWTQIITTLIISVFGGGGTIVSILGVRKIRADKKAENELEANRLLLESTRAESTDEDKTWARQEQQLLRMETKLNSLEHRINTLEAENGELKNGLTVQAIWGARFILNAQQAGQHILIPVPIPSAVMAFCPPPTATTPNA
jgi:hypothetical protein